MPVAHLLTNVAPWGPDHALARVDAALERAGSRPLALPWHEFALAADGDHFTDEGFAAFATRLCATIADAIAPSREVYLFADSTIDHNDWEGGEWHGRASKLIRDLMADRGVRCTVDAVRGSGFGARCAHLEHFHARLSKAFRASRPSVGSWVVFVGGWNDVRERREVPVEYTVRLAQRFVG